MLLAIDTATQRASLALDDGVEILAEHNWLCVNNHTMELAPQVEQLVILILLLEHPQTIKK